MTQRTIQLPNGKIIHLSSDELSPATLALAEILVELAVEQGSPTIIVSEEEIMARLRAKGYRSDGEPIH